MKTIIYIQIISILITINSIKAQSLDSLLNEALQKNYYLRSYFYKIQASEQKIFQQTLPEPEVSLELNQFDLNRFDIWNNSISNSLKFTQMFPLGGKLKSMREVNKINSRITKVESQAEVNFILNEISKLYYELFLISQKIKIQNEQIDLLTQSFSYYENLYKLNRISLSSLILLKSEITTYQIDLIKLNEERESKIIELCKLIGRDFNEPVQIDSIIPLPQITINEKLFEELIDNNPILKKMNDMIEMTQAEKEAIKRELYPDLMLSGMIMQMPKGMIITSKSLNHTISQNNSDIMFGLMGSITLPFAPWSKRKIDSQIEEQNNLIKSYEYEIKEMQRDLISMVKKSLVKLESYKNIINRIESETIPAYEKSFQLKISAFETDESSILQLLEISRMLLMEKMKYWMYYSDYLIESSELKFLTGGYIK